MTLQWKILEEVQEPFPEEDAAPPPPPRRRWARPLLALCLIALTLLAGILLWKNRQQEERLRHDLTEVIEAEARAQAFGLVEQVGTFADVDAPPNWRLRYLHLFEPERQEGTQQAEWALFYFGIDTRREIAALPVLQALTLEEGGERVRVEVAWQGISEVTEQRAYRLVEGRWRRTPLQAGLACSWESGSQITYRLVDGEWQSAPCREEEGTGEMELTFPAVTLRGRTTDVMALSEPGDFYLGLGGLREHLQSRWPDSLLLERPILLTIDVQEFGGPVLEERPWLEGMSILLNSPESLRLSPHIPLAEGSQYRLVATNMLLFSLLDHRKLDGASLLLVQAEARRWALTEEERRTLRNAWRTELSGNWSSPLAPPSPTTPSDSRETFVSYWLSWHLLMEWVIERGYVSSPGALAEAMLEHPQLGQDELLMELTGLSRETLDSALREYALTPEP